MNYEKKYKEALERARKLYEQGTITESLNHVFPELKESEDEQSRKWILEYLYDGLRKSDEQFKDHFKTAIAWLEKQEEFKSSRWTEGDVVRHGGILALVTNGRKAMKSNCEQITIQYPDEWVKTGTKERKYFFEELEKQGEQKPQGKSALEAINEEKFDNANKVEPKDYSSIDPHFFKTTDKIEPKFKVKYAGSEYNVFETKDIAGVTFYGIEDEPNHIDYVQAENCEIIDGYGIKKNGCSFPTKPIMFSEQKPADKVKPKFHEGEWIVENNFNRNPVQITSFEEDKGVGIKVWLSNGTGTYVDFLKGYHKWTIEDAKDGDVLAAHECIALFKEIDGLNIKCHCTYHFMNNPSFYVNTLQNKSAFHPATKEQRDALEKAMADAGYTFDFEKKELKEIEQPKLTEFEDAIKDMMDDYRDAIDGNDATVEDVKEKAAYLLSLIPCKSAEWSEEDEQITLSIEQVMNCASLLNIVPEKMDKIRTWLKSLKGRTQPKQEWGEDKTEVMEE